MKVKILAVLLFASSCLAFPKDKELASGDKEKRATASYTTPRAYVTASPDVAYATAKVSPQTFANQQQQSKEYQIKYVQQQQPQQYQYEYEPQQTTKLSPAKLTYGASHQIPFSLASDVSSFSYQSPLVSYSNLGLLKQSVGKIAESQVAAYNPQQYTSEAKVAYTQQQPATHQQPQVTYVPQKVAAYAVAPQKSYKPQIVLQQQQKYAYAPVPAKVVYATAQQAQQYAKIQQQQPQQQQVLYAQPQKAQQYEAEEEVSYQYQPQVAYAAVPQQHYQQQQQQQTQQAYHGQPQQAQQPQYYYVQAQPQYEAQPSNYHQSAQYYQQAQAQATAQATAQASLAKYGGQQVSYEH